MPTKKTNVAALPEPMNRNWGWLLGLGILFVILGSVGLGMVVGLTLASMVFLGALLIIAGVSQLVDTVKCKHWKGAVGHALIAIFYIIAGGLVIYDPFLASAIITALLASLLIIIGISRFLMAMMLKGSPGWGWLLFAGVIAIALGIMILMHWPISGLWVIGLFIAIEILVDGWTYIFLALSMRNNLRKA